MRGVHDRETRKRKTTFDETRLVTLMTGKYKKRKYKFKYAQKFDYMKLGAYFEYEPNICPLL